MKVGLKTDEILAISDGKSLSKNVPRIRAFCLRTAILDELHWTVANGAIRELAATVSTHRMGDSQCPGETGG